MSASLVGSEMCIRDSLWTWLYRRLPGRRARSAAGWQLERRHQSHCNQPVSYTHLTLPTICSV
eukprot:4626071-Alexandrium_andersonii.AAC.1